jgi:hypothetical protein
MSCSCIFSEDDWDEVVKRCVECQYNFDNRDQIQKEEKVKRAIKNKRIVNEKKRNKKFMRNYLKKLFRKIIVKIQANHELNVFVNEMSNIFEDVEDSLMLKYIVYTKNVNTLSDLLEINGLYHLTFSRYIIDKRIKLKYLESYKGELFELKWSDQAKYFLRTLIGLTRFGDIDYGHMRAIFWQQDEVVVKNGIKRLIDNQYVFEEIRTNLMDRFVEYFENKYSMNNLYQTYNNLGLNLDSIYLRCLSSLAEF